jgi:hypothetical protein
MPFFGRIPGWRILDIDPMPIPPNPEITDNIQQTLARLMAFDKGDNTNRILLADAYSRLIVGCYQQFECNQRATDGAFPINNGATQTLKTAPLINHWLIYGLTFNSSVAGRYIARISGVQIADFLLELNKQYDIPIPSCGIHVIPQSIGLQLQNLSGANASVGFTMLYAEIPPLPIVLP